MANTPKRGDQVGQRINVVKGLKVRGMSNSEIVEHGVKEWAVDERTVVGYITAARLIIKSEFAEDSNPEHTRAEVTAMFKKIVSLSLAQKKYSAAVAATRELAQLAGLYAPQRVEVTGRIEFAKAVDLKDASPEEVEVLAKLLKMEPMALPAHEDDEHEH